MHVEDVNLLRKIASALTRAYRLQFIGAALFAILAGFFFLTNKPLLGLIQSLLSCSQLYFAFRSRRMAKQSRSRIDRVACPKCKSGMEEGFLMENGHYSSSSSEKSFIGSVKGTVTYHVHTYRCIACGYLESYTR